MTFADKDAKMQQTKNWGRVVEIFVLMFHSGAYEDTLEENLGVFSDFHKACVAAEDYLKLLQKSWSYEGIQILKWEERNNSGDRKTYDTDFLEFGDTYRFYIEVVELDQGQFQDTKALYVPETYTTQSNTS